jgi:hypothetical protein
MQTESIIALLIAERDRLNAAIEALQGSVKRRGRPPVTKVSEAAVPAPASVGRKHTMGAVGAKVMSVTKERPAAKRAGKLIYVKGKRTSLGGDDPTKPK